MRGELGMSVLKRTLYLFREPGEKNTGKAVEIAKKRTLEEGIKHVVVASARGRTGVKAAQAFRGTGVKVVVVAESPEWAELEEASLRKLKALKATVLRGVHAFHGVEKSYTALRGGASIAGVAEDTLRRIS